jgi:agmatine deiminase
MSSSEQTCREQGFCMPAEWEKHDSIWLAWPYDPTTFPDKCSAWKTFMFKHKGDHDGEQVNLLSSMIQQKKATKMFDQNRP